MALPHNRNIFDYPARFQFGERGAPCNGHSCCTDTCLKMIVEFYKDTTYSLAQVRKYAQMRTAFNERPCTGINHVESLNGLRAMGVSHYKAGFGVDANDVWRYLDIGPVLIGVYYGSYPDQIGKCGHNNAEVAGKTDCTFRGAHAILAIGKRYHTVSGKTHRDIYVRDPDHNSPSRPERPKYDRITITQLSAAMRNLAPNTAFKSSYALYPTRKK